MTSVPEKKCDNSPVLRWFPRIAGGLLALLGVAVIVAWHAHWTFLIQPRPALAPMKYNTALCFILCGMALSLLTTKRAGPVTWLGGIAALVGLLTLIEYVAGRNFGVDQLLLQ